MPATIDSRRTSTASLLRHIVAIVAVLIIAGCGGGSCGGGGCSSCSGITPLADGFEPTNRIENAGALRLMPSGLKFLQTNLGTLAKGLLGSSSNNGVLTFDIPATSGSASFINYSVCSGGANPTANPPSCVADIDLRTANLTITPAGPYDLHITGTLPIRVQDLPISTTLGSFDAAISGDGSCPGDATSYDAIPVDMDIAIHVDTNAAHTARYGYSQIIVNQVVDQSAVSTNLGNNINFCNGFLGSVLNIGFLKSLIVGQLVTPLVSTLTTQIDSQLCQKATATDPCPTGTTADSSMICRYNNDPNNACASIIVGTDGHMNLGALLASISPGTQGGLDFLFAAGGADKNTNDPAMKLLWGDLDPVSNGATMGMFGGAQPNPLSKCVPLSTATLPTGIPIPDELLGSGDVDPNWPAGVEGPDVGIAVNERFANYALNGLYNSGLLCIGVSTESIPLLSSGTLGLLAPSSKTLGLQENPQQVAIVIRPSSPPTLVFGNGTDITTDPLMRIDLKQVSLDFYMFSLDRFIRFMTGTFDLDVPVNLTSSSAGLTPVIAQIGVANGVVTNSQLLDEAPADLASSLSGLIGSIVGQELAGSLKPINLNSSLSSLGLNLYIPDTVAGKGSPGLRKLSKGTDNYLGIFASFELPGMAPGPRRIPSTNVQVLKKTVDPAGLKLNTLTRDNMPVVEILAVSTLDDGSRAVEFQYQVDNGFWHPFTPSRYLTVNDDFLRVQGRHVISVRTRVVGDPESLDETPAQAEVVIDIQPPRVSVHQGEDGKVTLDVRDLVTADPTVRYRFDDGAWSDWTLASRVASLDPGAATQIAVEAQDAEGNLGTVKQLLVRGRFDGTAASCGCTTVGNDRAQGTPALFLLGIGLAGLGTRIARRRKAAARREARHAIGGLAVIACASMWSGCSCNGATKAMAGATSGGSCPSCVELQPGLIGEYSSSAVNGADIWVAGYSEADWDNGNTYGDLVVGKWDGTKVAWNQVDGVPSTPAVDPTVFDINGFRGGQTAPGDDVGLWTSIAIGGDGNPAVSYLDNTNQALKFAQYNGTTWAVQTVDSVPNGVVGRYSKLIFLNGNFVIAYQSIAPGGTGGALISKVRVATSAGATPTAGTWTFEDVATVATTPCRSTFCASTEACVSTTKVCTTTLASTMCTTACTSSQACVTSGGAPTCLAIWDSTKIDAYPDAIGDYITLAPDGQGGFGIAYYDRTNGNLVTALKSGGTWTNTIVDGEGATAPGTGGDSGIGASLFIETNGDWHIAYVNGYSEALQYIKVTKGTTPLTPEIIDNGLGIAGTPFTDGQHLVGDDAHLIVLAGGEVQVTYADSTAGALHYAIGTPGSTGHMWNVQAITQSGFAGAFSSIVVASGQTQLMNWWRVGGGMVMGDVRLVSPP